MITLTRRNLAGREICSNNELQEVSRGHSPEGKKIFFGKDRMAGDRNDNTRKGYWVIAGSGILTHTITNERLARRGYYDISEAYKSMYLI